VAVGDGGGDLANLNDFEIWFAEGDPAEAPEQQQQ